MASYQGTTIKPGSREEIAAQVAAIDEATPAPVVVPKTPAPITPSDLSGSPSPFKVTAAAAPTKVAGLGSSLEADAAATADAYQARLDAKAKTAEAAKSSSFEDLMKAQLGMTGKAEATDKAYADTVDPAEADLKDINQQIIAEQVALRRRVEEIEKNPQGLFGPALQDQIDQATRDSVRKQADLSVIQLARQGKYDSAKAIADRAVEASIEKQKNLIDALQFNYEENKDEFTKDEQRAFESAQDARNRALDMQKAKELADYEQKIKENDPLYRAQVQKIKAELATTGATTITNPDAAKYAPAISIILGSGKFTQDQKASFVAAVNNGEDPFAVIKNQTKTILGQTGENKLTSYETAKAQLDDVQNLLTQYYAAGGTTNFLSGNYEKVINKLGEVKDPKLVEIATQIAAALQIYRNAVSGTAYSVQEGVDIASIFPGINKTQGLNEAILKGRKAAFDSTIDGTYRTVLGSTYDALKAVEDGKTPPINVITAPDGTQVQITD